LGGIDWAEVRRRIAETPISVPPKHVKRPNRSPESLERRKVKARERQKRHYWNHHDEMLAKYHKWEQENPDKVKAKRQRYYERLKQDPERLERKRQRNREYKRRKKLAAKAA